MNIFLIGMPGSGKSSIGLALATRLGYRCIDSDSEIEKKNQLSISEIFTIKGEDYFRKEEFSFLNLWKGDHYVIATGGGMSCTKKNITIMKKKGHVIYLDCSVEVLLKRLQSQEISKRPKLSGAFNNSLPQLMADLLKKREKYYKQADFIVNSQQSITDIVDIIENNLSQ